MPIECGHYPACFLHFFDIHFLDEYRGNNGIDEELLLATKFAFLCSTSLIIPMSSYFENATCRNIINNIKKDVPEYDVFFVGNSNSIEEFASSKLYQYDKVSSQYKIYEKVLNDGINIVPIIKRKRTDTTGIIKLDWEKSVNDGSFFNNFVSLEKVLPQDFHEKCNNIHMLLDGLAYIPEHVNKILFGNMDLYSSLGGRISSFINKSYFLSYLDFLSPCSVVTELRILNSNYVDSDKYQLHIPYYYLLKHLSRIKLLRKISESPFSLIYTLKSDDKMIAEIAKSIERYYAERNELKVLNQNFINYGITAVMGANVDNTGVIEGTHNP